MSDRTFKVKRPHMEGSDVADWQSRLNWQLKRWKVDTQLKVDGDYGIATRDMTASILHGLGIDQDEMSRGVTPELRIKVRDPRKRSDEEKARARSRAGWRKRFRKRHADKGSTAPPLLKILQDSWGYHRGVHDGIDLISPANALIFAICDGTVIDVRAGGWWGKAPSGDVSKGDGIIQIRCETDAGPFVRGMHFGYGHAEHARVRVGDKVKAGDVLGRAGLAVVPHIHFMCNGGGTTKGVGDRDPRPCLDYALGKR